MARWSADWNVADPARHAAILLVPDPGVLPNASTAHVIDQLVSSAADVGNRLFSWDVNSGWQEKVASES